VARIADSYPWPDARSDLKSYFGIAPEDTADEAKLRLWFLTAVDSAELYVDKDFVDSAGASIAPPAAITVGIYEYVRALRDSDQRASGVKAVKTGQLAETYAQDGIKGKLALLAALPFWRPYKRDLLAA